jgi:hypothetical protein
MTTKLLLLACAVIIIFILVYGVHAQAPATAGLSLNAATSLSQCPQPAAGSGMWLICPVNATAGGGVYSSINGAAYALLGAGAQGVTSFNGRTGAVVSAAGDYSYPQISGTMPFPAGCPVGTVGPAGITFGSGCK